MSESSVLRVTAISRVKVSRRRDTLNLLDGVEQWATLPLQQFLRRSGMASGRILPEIEGV